MLERRFCIWCINKRCRWFSFSSLEHVSPHDEFESFNVTVDIIPAADAFNAGCDISWSEIKFSVRVFSHV